MVADRMVRTKWHGQNVMWTKLMVLDKMVADKMVRTFNLI